MTGCSRPKAVFDSVELTAAKKTFVVDDVLQGLNSGLPRLRVFMTVGFKVLHFNPK
jgi:hypothetical protein